jgi:hypothetical protein
MNMFTIRKYEFMRILSGNTLNKVCNLFIPVVLGFAVLGSPVAFADDAVNLKVLVITTGDQDSELAYIKPVLDEMGVRYDLLNAATQELTSTLLSADGCLPATVGCVGNYNGVILTDSGMLESLTPLEWDLLHDYEKNFHVREAVLSGWPGIYWDPNYPWGVYLDYGLTYSSSITSASLPSDSNAQWTVPIENSKTVFEYVNTANPLPITDFAYAAKPRNDASSLRDGTVPSVTPLLQTPAGEALVSIIKYSIPFQTTPVREVLLSTISNASFFIHSQVLSYEFVNWVTQGVFVGGRFVYMNVHLDDLFLANFQWDVNANAINPLLTYRLNSDDINNAVSKQAAFRAAHPTAGNDFKLDFAFNGTGAVLKPNIATPTANVTDNLVTANSTDALVVPNAATPTANVMDNVMTANNAEVVVDPIVATPTANVTDNVAAANGADAVADPNVAALITNLTDNLAAANGTNAVVDPNVATLITSLTDKLVAANDTGIVVNPNVAAFTVNLTDDLVAAVVANKDQFRFLNHTFRHIVMDNAPVPADAPCDYRTLSTVADLQTEITNNRIVWELLGLPEQADNNKVLVSGNHSGLKDMKCTSSPEKHPDMFNVQDDDVPFETGANPLFMQAAANAGVDYLASDTSQINQATEKYISEVNDGSASDRLLLPRYPTSIFYNVTSPDQLVSEYNYMFHDRFVAAGQDPCTVGGGALCTTRTYAKILAAEANTALQHILSFKKYPHFFHQGNVAKYDVAGNTLQFDWLNAVYSTYEQLFKLPVKNIPYYLIGDMTKDSLTAKSATISAIWDRTTNQVTLSANKTVNNLLVTGLQSQDGDLYGGQYIKAVNIGTISQTFAVNQALTQ